jgi:hypothetical protein
MAAAERTTIPKVVGLQAALDEALPAAGGTVTGRLDLSEPESAIRFGRDAGTVRTPILCDMDDDIVASTDLPGVPGVFMAWLGGTSGQTTMPGMLSRYDTTRGAIYSGVEAVFSNKRYNIDGGIQPVSALSDGSELTYVCISPDINGPSLGIESHADLSVSGHENQCIWAGYDLDAIHGGTSPFSEGYGTKKVACTSDGTVYYGANLGTNPATLATLKTGRVGTNGWKVYQNLYVGGKIGFGTDSPQTPIELFQAGVAGNFVWCRAESSGAVLNITPASGATGLPTIDTQNDFDLILGRNNAEKLRLGSNTATLSASLMVAGPKFGFNTTAPAVPIEWIQAGAGASFFWLRASSTDAVIGVTPASGITGLPTVETANDFDLVLGRFAVEKVRLTTAGVTITGATTLTSTIGLKSYTVATLPTPGTRGRAADCSNARNAGEGAGLGTGSIVEDDGTNWKIPGVASAVAA